MANAPGPASAARPVSGQIRSVQGLRAIAALFVVAFHSTVLWHDRFDSSAPRWENGNAGVDLFFVISGFIMVISSGRLLTAPGGWRRFLVLRLVRITPMYWLATTAKLAALAALPTLAIHSRPNAWNTVASYLFIPSRDAAGVVRPVLDVGWTLSFEMLFYLVFAASILVRKNVLSVVTPVMLLLAAASPVVAGRGSAIDTLADPIVLEFVLGLAIGQMAARLRRSTSAGWELVAVLGLTCLAAIPTDGRWERVGIWGLAAAVTLAASVACEPWCGPRIPNLAVKIGESSYSLYLTHGFILPVIGVLAVRLSLRGTGLGVFLILCSLVVSTAAGLVVYQFVEVPVTGWLRRLVHDRGVTTVAAPTSPI